MSTATVTVRSVGVKHSARCLWHTNKRTAGRAGSPAGMEPRPATPGAPLSLGVT